MSKCSIYVRPTLNPEVGKYAVIISPTLREIDSVCKNLKVLFNLYHPMNFLIWNCRGSTSLEFRENFRELLRSHNPALVVLLETHRADHLSMPHEFNFSNVVAVPAEGRAGGIAILWHANLLNVSTVAITHQEIHCMIQAFWLIFLPGRVCSFFTSSIWCFNSTVFAVIMEHNSQSIIPRVKLGTQGLEVSKLGFGCLGLSGIMNTPLSHEAGCSIIKEAFNKGITFFDTSDLYGHEGDNEIMVGKALKQLPREQVQLATKFGLILSEDFQFHVKGSPEYVRKCCEESLKRLDVDYIDLYYPHRIDTTVPIENTMEELKKLAEEGKIRYIGLSEASVDTIKRAHAVHPIAAVQLEYSLWTREIEEDVIPLCRELGIGIVAYSPLGHGFFGGKAVTESLPEGSMMAALPRFNEQNLEKNKVLYTRFANLAAKHGCTPPQLALAWVMHQGDDVIPIPGTTKIKNLNDNIQSVGVKLTPEDLKEITDTIPISEVFGERDHAVISKYDYRFANTPLKN
ncbi:perakine reductase [Capsicum annuum]|uniref:perakine reductase n=1 Tax=Capsicum annuum TaxID=4072 RepID=UPI001FB13F10|nr:perakine reductase [Capsicum annuum]